MAPPREQDLPAAGSTPLDLDLSEKLSDEEAKRLGLMEDEHVDWDGHVDIDLDLGADEHQPLQAVDISIDGLPAAEEALPAHGRALIDHLQIGTAYRMHRDGDWIKVARPHQRHAQLLHLHPRDEAPGRR